jgi:hypothetical protein
MGIDLRDEERWGSLQREPRTEALRLQLYEEGMRDLYFFAKGILGFDRLGPPVQTELCDFLQGRGAHGRWQRAMVVVYRGGYKSTITSQAWPVYMGAYCVDLAKDEPERWGHLAGGWACKLIENSSDNAKDNHVMPIVNLFRSSQRAEFLQWLLRHRLPKNLQGWNADGWTFIQPNALKKATLTYWGMESRFEGWHGDAVICDDLEGSDAEKSDVASKDAWRAYKAAVPLLEEQSTGQILLVGTPHGDDPLVYGVMERERDRDGNVIYDNERRKVKVFWLPLLDRSGKPHEPHRYRPNDIELLQLDGDTFDQQFMLRKKRGASMIFDEHAIRHFAMEWADPTRRVIRYRARKLDLERLNQDGTVKLLEEDCTVRVEQLRRYVHVDPKHRLDEMMKKGAKSRRPMRAAIVVTGVAPDFNVFPLEIWLADVGLDELTRKAMELHRKWKAYRMTFEAVGAQAWFETYLRDIERMQRTSLFWASVAGQVDRAKIPGTIHSTLIEANKTNQSKEWIYRERVAPWVNFGGLHLHLVEHQPLIQAMLNVTSADQELDALDATSQGCDVWEAPADPRAVHREALRRKRFIDAYCRDPRTGFVNRSAARAAAF